MKAQYFARYVEQFGLPCIEQQHQRCVKSFTLFWLALFFCLICGTIYQIEAEGDLWLLACLDLFAFAAFFVSGWQRYQLHCYINRYRQKHADATPARSFSGF